MMSRDDEFIQKLLAAFREETREHLKAISDGLIELENPAGDAQAAEVLELMYRETHSLKGAARSVSMKGIEAVCQATENVFSALREGRIPRAKELFDALHRALDATDAIASGRDGEDIQPVIDQLNRLAERPAGPAVMPRPVKADFTDEPASEPPALHPAPQPIAAAALIPAEITTSAEEGAANADPVDVQPKSRRWMQGDTVRISVEKLDPLLRKVGEMVSVKLTAAQRVTDLLEIAAAIDEWKKQWSLLDNDKSLTSRRMKRTGQRASDANGRQAAKATEFLQWSQTHVKLLEGKVRNLVRSVQNDSEIHSDMVDDLLEDMISVLMLPSSSLLDVLPRMVRDLARESGKELTLNIQGGDIEIDRRILDEMRDPLIHLVRNCVDHGIEKPEERELRGKPRAGVISVSVSQLSGNQLELLVSDDGAGIDAVKVRESASRRGRLSEQEKAGMDAQDALSLIFRSEVSTSAAVTSISGRGLGLAIVRDKVEALGGSISVRTEPGAGASFRILLPVTLSTFRGILVDAHGQLCIAPTANVERVARLRKDQVKTAGNRDTVDLDDRAAPLIRLGDVLGVPRPPKNNGNSAYFSALILRSGDSVAAFSVDEVLQEQEVLVKPLNKQLSRVRNIAGATVLGSGLLAPILNVADLMKSAFRTGFNDAAELVREAQSDDRTKAILVVEDSITSRMLLKNILETAGYEVTTAVDGAEGWTAVRSRAFDLVVSDIEMPRMNGLELTAKIRGSGDLGDMPVVLVTSRGSREDREGGIDAGANAYIVKGSFDQDNLLETVRRLI